MTFTANHDFTLQYPWIYIGGGLNDNRMAGIHLISAIPAANQIQFQDQACTALVGTIYAGGFAVLDYEALQDNLSTMATWSTSILGLLRPVKIAITTALMITTDQNAILDRVTNQSSGNVLRDGTSEWVGAVILLAWAIGIHRIERSRDRTITDSYLSGGQYNLIDWWTVTISKSREACCRTGRNLPSA